MAITTANRVYERPATLEEALKVCDHLIKSSVAGFVKKHRCDYDETLSDALFAMIAAFKGHNPEKGSFGARVCHEVWCGMMDGLRARAIRASRYPTKYTNLNQLSQRSKPNLEDFKERLSTDDAKTVVQLLVDLDSTASPGKRRKKLLHDALQEAGWAAARIIESFREIGEAIREQCPRRLQRSKPEEVQVA